MKKYLKKIIFTLVILSLINVKALASTNTPSNVILEGNADGIVFIPGDEPFLQGQKMLPGDKVSRNMVIKNNHDVPYELFIRAERISEKEEYDLLEKLELTIEHNGIIIYEGHASGKDGLEENISLGVYEPGDIVNLYAKVELDGQSTGNEYKNKKGQVDWIFTAISTDVENPEEQPNTPDNPEEPPKTGDSSIFIYVLLAVISLVLLLRGKLFKFIRKVE